MGIRSFLSNDLLTELNNKQVTFLSQASKTQKHYNSTERWRSSDELGLLGAQASEWTNFIKELCGEVLRTKYQYSIEKPQKKYSTP
jgi:hypothetical protein